MLWVMVNKAKMMNKQKWKIIEDFVLEDGRFDSDDFEEFLEVINNDKKNKKERNSKVKTLLRRKK